MLFLLANAAFLILVLGYCWFAGAALDRIGVAAALAALVLTFLANSTLGFAQSGPVVLVIDCALLAAITAIALRSPRYWPVWFAGFQLAAVMFGLASLLWPAEDAVIYQTLGGFFGIPALLAMALGLFLDRMAEAREPRTVSAATEHEVAPGQHRIG